MREKKPHKTKSFTDYLWDIWCTASIIGVWPRYIEPRLISTTRLKLRIPNLPRDLKGLTILQFSDLHYYSGINPSFLGKLVKKISKLHPDLIVFTGDFICYSTLTDDAVLSEFLNRFHAPYGCYAVLGNHDYDQVVSVSDAGDYDVIGETRGLIDKGFKRLIKPVKLSKVVTSKAQSVEYHQDLIELIKTTPFKLLDNHSTTIRVKDSCINICGVGEHMLGRCLPDIAFKNYNPQHPGIVLAHNPDCVPRLKKYPGDIILCGHTHGGQVNLPFIWKRLLFLENMRYKRGLVQVDNKWVYINRGVGSSMPFRWFSRPEILLLTLE